VRFPDTTRLDVEKIVGDESRLVAGEHDRNAQTVRANHIVISPRGVEAYPVNLRYAWPAELDLMATLAGLRLTSRVADWTGSPFINTSPAHVSTWHKAA